MDEYAINALIMYQIERLKQEQEEANRESEDEEDYE